MAQRGRRRWGKQEGKERSAKWRTPKQPDYDRSAAKRLDEATRRNAKERSDQASRVRQLIKCAERMSETSGFPVGVETAPTGVALLPWIILATLRPPEYTTYSDLYAILRVWEDDLILEGMIRPDRLSWIRFEYLRYDEDGNAIGKVEGCSATGAGRWPHVISEAAAWCDPDDADSLAAIYQLTGVVTVQVYFGVAPWKYSSAR